MKFKKNLLLGNYWANINQILLKWFLDGPLPKLCPVYKNKGNPLDPKNFRPITILSCLGKLFTAILNERLYRFSEEDLLMNENQFGFRKSYSTTDSFFYIIFIFWDLKNKKETSVLCLCRLRKGFWHSMERCTMVQITIESHKWQNVYTIILNMYTDVKSCITYNYCKSDYAPANKVWWVYRNHPVHPARPSVCLSVRPCTL